MKERNFKESNKVVLRGGAWYYDFADLFRAHFRLRLFPVTRSDLLGFRCALPEESPIARRLVRIK